MVRTFELMVGLLFDKAWYVHSTAVSLLFTIVHNHSRRNHTAHFSLKWNLEWLDLQFVYYQ